MSARTGHFSATLLDRQSLGAGKDRPQGDEIYAQKDDSFDLTRTCFRESPNRSALECTAATDR
jgi:hypothetical protein